jgi:hypothetical protein
MLTAWQQLTSQPAVALVFWCHGGSAQLVMFVFKPAALFVQPLQLGTHWLIMPAAVHCSVVLQAVAAALLVCCV